MKQLSFLIIVLSFFLFSASAWAVEGPVCEKKEYACYKKWTEYCKSPDHPWNSSPGIGRVNTDYAELTASAQRKKINDLIARESNPTEKARLQSVLSENKIGMLDGFKSVEIARAQYQNTMNRIFACAVTASRIEKTNKVLALVSKGGSSNIADKLKADIKKLGNQMKNQNCATNSTEGKLTDYSRAIAASATAEYCIYRNYLDYLDTNIRTDYTKVMDLEKTIGVGGENKPNPTTLSTAASAMNLRSTQIMSDIARAESTLPKALVAFREMERTYSIHLMLLIIYDDYLELRQNANTYLNAVSQLFEKAKNAQSANQ